MAVGNYKLFRLLNLVFTLQTVQTLMRCCLQHSELRQNEDVRVKCIRRGFFHLGRYTCIFSFALQITFDSSAKALG